MPYEPKLVVLLRKITAGVAIVAVLVAAGFLIGSLNSF